MLLIFPTQGLDAASALYREYAKSILSATADREKLFDSPGFREVGKMSSQKNVFFFYVKKQKCRTKNYVKNDNLIFINIRIYRIWYFDVLDILIF